MCGRNPNPRCSEGVSAGSEEVRKLVLGAPHITVERDGVGRFPLTLIKPNGHDILTFISWAVGLLMNPGLDKIKGRSAGSSWCPCWEEPAFPGLVRAKGTEVFSMVQTWPHRERDVPM